jgi:transposase InsO family protein
MRENGLHARQRRKFIPTTNPDHGLEVCENPLNRKFQAGGTGEKWVSDITCLRTTSGWVVLDLFDRKVIKTLKRELETPDGNHSAGEVRQSVFMYLEAYYNRVRLHSVPTM